MSTQSMQIAIIENAQAGGLVTMNAKGKSGSFARAIAFANRESRGNLAAGMMMQQLKNGQYRPLVNDILTCGLVPKANLPWVAAGIPASGSVNKDTLINLCHQVKQVYDTKKNKNGDPVVLKGEKAFVFGFIKAIVADTTSDVVEA